MKPRELIKEDLHQLLCLYEHLHEQDSPLPETSVVETIWDSILDDEKLKYFGVFADDRLLASCAITIVPNLTRSCRPFGVIENVVVHSDWRRQGLGKQVLESALEYAWSADCYKVMLLTGRLDEETFKFYESAGFDRFSKQAFLAKPD